jgi:hypothetical protein
MPKRFVPNSSQIEGSAVITCYGHMLRVRSIIEDVAYVLALIWIVKLRQHDVIRRLCSFLASLLATDRP